MRHDETPQEQDEREQPSGMQEPVRQEGEDSPGGVSVPGPADQSPAYRPPLPVAGQAPVKSAAPLAAEDGSVVVDGILYRPAGFMPRLGAFLIDFVILSMFHALLLKLANYQPLDEQQMMDLLDGLLNTMLSMRPPEGALLAQLEEVMRVSRIVGWLNVAICFAYYTVFHTVAGATLGKLCLGLTVLTSRGHRISYGTAFTRYLVRLLLSRFFFGGAIVVFFDPLRRTAYDMVAGTNVFRQAGTADPRFVD